MRLTRCLFTLLLAVLLLNAWPALAAGSGEDPGLVEQSSLLDAAFSMLERGNPFLVRYNAITGADVDPFFEAGLPYFAGGTGELIADGEQLLFSRLPAYAKGICQASEGIYRKNKSYLYGLDNDGFTQWVFSEAGWPAHDTLKAMINQYGKYGKKNHVYSHRRGKEMPPYEKVAATLQQGDLLVATKGNRHVMMFIGTLRGFGYTADTAPELADYLDYTLVIHCGPNPDYAARMQTFLETHGDDPYYENVSLPDGGVAVSIIGVEPEEAPHRASDNGVLYSYFDLDGYRLTVWDLEAASAFCWFRVNGI